MSRALTIDRERLTELVGRLPNSDARDELFEIGRPLIRALAGRFTGRGEPLDDLVQVASIAMLKAIDNYDAQKGDSLLAYATAVILGELRHHFRDAVRMVRIPRPILEARRRIDDCSERLTQSLGRTPVLSEIIAETGMDEEAVVEAVASIGSLRPISIDSLDDGPRDHGVIVSGDHATLIDAEAVSVHLAGLPARERQILFLRFFRGYSQAEVAEEIGVSQVQVSRILSASLSRIKASMAE